MANRCHYKECFGGGELLFEHADLLYGSSESEIQFEHEIFLYGSSESESDDSHFHDSHDSAKYITILMWQMNQS